MQNPNTSQDNTDPEMLPEYDFSGQGAVRGKYFRKFRAGHTIKVQQADGSVTTTHIPPAGEPIVLAPDVREYFPDEESVNTALRTLIALVQRKPA